jgi:hypothetical protein
MAGYLSLCGVKEINYFKSLHSSVHIHRHLVLLSVREVALTQGISRWAIIVRALCQAHAKSTLIANEPFVYEVPVSAGIKLPHASGTQNIKNSGEGQMECKLFNTCLLES